MRIATLCTIVLLTLNGIVSQEWEQISSPPDNFFTDHTFGFGLGDKGYLVTGTDLNYNNMASFYEYDPADDSWTKLDDFPGGARGFAIGDTWNGKAYFGFGTQGFSTFYNDLWEYDPATEEWTELPSCPCPERTHPAFVAHNGKVFVGLGGGPAGNLNDWWIYDMETQSWSEGEDFPSSRRHHPYQFAIGDYIYAGFGHGNGIFNDWYRYDPSSDEWDQVASLGGEGRVAGTQFSFDGKGYALSGEGEQHTAMETGEFWSYDPILDQWVRMPNHPGTSRWAPASFLIGNYVYLLNGVQYFSDGTENYMEEAYRYDLTAEITSVEDLAFENKLSISPNPASNFIDLNIEDANLEQTASYKIFSAAGKLIQGQRLNDNRLDISSLSTGTYFIEVSNGQQIFKQRFIKQ